MITLLYRAADALRRRSLAGDHGQQQAVLRIDRRVVPVVPLVIVAGIVRVAILLLLADEVPLLVELDLTGPRGKKPRVRRGVGGRGRQRSGRTG